jgi:hypothetical protein
MYKSIISDCKKSLDTFESQFISYLIETKQFNQKWQDNLQNNDFQLVESQKEVEIELGGTEFTIFLDIYITDFPDIEFDIIKMQILDNDGEVIFINKELRSLITKTFTEVC